MRLPNGYGSVYKLSGNRRKPFVARKTIGYDDKGYPQYLIIGYYEKREQALNSLADYNQNPYDVDRSKMTFAEIYSDWSNRYYPTEEEKQIEKETHQPVKGKFSKKSIGSFIASYHNCEKIQNLKYIELRTYHFQDILDNCELGSSSLYSLKNLFNKLDTYALEMDIITKGYSQFIKINSDDVRKVKAPFSRDEINLLWKNEGELFLDSIIILVYTGLRLQELLWIETGNVNLKDKYFTGGLKTASGKNRLIPIHPDIFHIIEKYYSPNNKYLLMYNNEEIGKTNYYTRFYAIMDKLGLATKHTPHDTRHGFRSELDRKGANKVCIDLLMGHRSAHVGERVYTHKTIEELKETILLLSFKDI